MNGDQGCIAPMVKAFKERHAFVVETFNKMPGVKCIAAGGAYYAFPDMRGAIESLAKRGVIKVANDLAFSEYLLEKAGVAVVPGSAFGAEGYIRISFATSMDNLKNALQRIQQAIA